MAVTAQKSPRVGRPPKEAKDKGEKGENILNAAEELFALRGYDGVTLRAVANQAGVDVALINYYFGSKSQLFDTVFERRAQILNEERLIALKQAQDDAHPEAVSVEKIIAAYLTPLAVAKEREDSGWKNYCALLAYINNSAVWGPQLMGKHFNQLADTFIDALKLALPNSSEADLYWCYHYMSGALTLTFANTGRIDKMSKGACSSDDFQTAYERMVPFMSAGFHRVCS
jgi:AcrR family transcriptional regulator